MVKINPLQGLSRKTITALGNTPEVEAFMRGLPYVPNTWGGYASRAVELKLCDPTTEAVVDLLGGPGIVDLSSSELAFQDEGRFLTYQSDFIYTKRKAHAESLIPDREYLIHEAKLIFSQWQIGIEEGNKRADEIQKLIGTGSISSCSALVMKMDGLRGGIDANLAEFVATMLSADVLEPESPARLSRFWLGGIMDVVEYTHDRYGSLADIEDVHTDEIALTAKGLSQFFCVIDASDRDEARALSKADWDYVYPVFAPPTSLSIIDGTEQ